MDRVLSRPEVHAKSVREVHPAATANIPLGRSPNGQPQIPAIYETFGRARARTVFCKHFRPGEDLGCKTLWNVELKQIQRQKIKIAIKS
jgi:hypothetical protein